MSSPEQLKRLRRTVIPPDGSQPPHPHLVFITHSSRDAWVAGQIAQKVRDCGAATFLDVEVIGVGQDFEERILSHLDKASELVALLTPWAIKSLYVWSEIGAAWSRRIPLVIILHGISLEKLRSDPKILRMMATESEASEIRRRINDREQPQPKQGQYHRRRPEKRGKERDELKVTRHARIHSRDN